MNAADAPPSSVLGSSRMKSDGAEHVELQSGTRVPTRGECTACFGTWKRRRRSDSGQPWSMDDFSAFTEGERALLEALTRHGVRFMLVGLSAAVLQGANTATRDIDICAPSTGDAPGSTFPPA
jgi:hypothetical protein